jgi:hypothetical protein
MGSHGWKGLESVSLALANAVDGVITNTGKIDLPLLPDFPVDRWSNAATKPLRKPKVSLVGVVATAW